MYFEEKKIKNHPDLRLEASPISKRCENYSIFMAKSMPIQSV